MKELTKDSLHEMFEYRDGGLFNRYTRSSRAMKGERAGSVKDRYRSVGLGGEYHLEHRLIFLMHYGYLPQFIDHIDGNPLNNRIENLRECTQTQNLANRQLFKTNNSGHKNVCWEKKNKKWRVRIGKDDKRIDGGLYTCIDDAHKKACEMREELFGEFANHGERVTA